MAERVKIPDRKRGALEVVDRIRPPQVRDYFTTSNGVKLKLKKVSPFIIDQIHKQLREPKPPVLFNEAKGREEENPNDPDYLEALKEHTEAKGLAAINTYFAFGTEVAELPEGIEDYKSEDWAEFLIDNSIPIPPRGSSRYVAWLRYYVLVTTEDMNGLFEACLMYSGHATEVEVFEATKSFRSDEERGTAAQDSTRAQG